MATTNDYLGDIFNVINELPNQLVELQNSLDRQAALLERIAVAAEARELREIGLNKHADLLEQGRVR